MSTKVCTKTYPSSVLIFYLAFLYKRKGIIVLKLYLGGWKDASGVKNVCCPFLLTVQFYHPPQVKPSCHHLWHSEPTATLLALVVSLMPVVFPCSWLTWWTH